MARAESGGTSETADDASVEEHRHAEEAGRDQSHALSILTQPEPQAWSATLEWDPPDRQPRANPATGEREERPVSIGRRAG